MPEPNGNPQPVLRYRIRQLEVGHQDHEMRLRAVEAVVAKVTIAAAVGSLVGGGLVSWIFSKF